jgi:hypothetical protein
MIARGLAAAVVALVAIASFPSGRAFAQDGIGVASATQNEVAGSLAGTSRAIAPGSRVFQDERISTGVQSMAQFLFLDETSLSIGPQSEVALDRFVYDPASGAGDVVLSATRGAFRFITGSQSPSNYELRTPFANIGVRGTIVDCYSTPAGDYCTAQEGLVVLIVNGVEYTLRPGEALYVQPNGTVTGPFTPDGEFFAVAGIVPFPVYGAFLPGDHEEFEVPDGSTVRLDEIFPQEPPCDVYYECECPYEVCN